MALYKCYMPLPLAVTKGLAAKFPQHFAWYKQWLAGTCLLAGIGWVSAAQASWLQAGVDDGDRRSTARSSRMTSTLNVRMMSGTTRNTVSSDTHDQTDHSSEPPSLPANVVSTRRTHCPVDSSYVQKYACQQRRPTSDENCFRSDDPSPVASNLLDVAKVSK